MEGGGGGGGGDFGGGLIFFCLSLSLLFYPFFVWGMLGWILGLVGFWRCGEKDTILQTGEEEDWVGEELLLVLAADVLFVGEYACLPACSCRCFGCGKRNKKV